MKLIFPRYYFTTDLKLFRPRKVRIFQRFAGFAEKRLNDWYTPADRKRKQEMVYECEVDEDGDEIEFIDSVICFPYSEAE